MSESSSIDSPPLPVGFSVLSLPSQSLIRCSANICRWNPLCWLIKPFLLQKTSRCVALQNVPGRWNPLCFCSKSHHLGTKKPCHPASPFGLSPTWRKIARFRSWIPILNSSRSRFRRIKLPRFWLYVDIRVYIMCVYSVSIYICTHTYIYRYV
jgi:hypothetical protein